MTQRLKPFKKFKDDDGMRRCQGEIFHALRFHTLRVGGPILTPEHVKQCKFAAKYDDDTFCRLHSSDGIETQKFIALSKELREAEILLRKHGRIITRKEN